MKLYILRHAEAAERSPKKYPDDTVRPLTTVGEKKMEKRASNFSRLGVKINLILSSPLLRARQTANIVRKQLHLNKDRLVLTDQLAPMGDFEQLVNEIREFHPVDHCLLVGHEPELSELISLLLVGDRSLSISLKKGALCCLSVDDLSAGKCATLDWLMSPSQLESK